MSKDRKENSKKQKFNRKEQMKKSSDNSKQGKERRSHKKLENVVHAGINPDI